jgi:hypothetical protein
MSFSCNTFLDYCATGPNYAISAGEKKSYMVDIKIGDNALNPSFSVRTQCTSEDCASELPKTWTCRYYYDSVTQLYEPLAPPEMS